MVDSGTGYMSHCLQAAFRLCCLSDLILILAVPVVANKKTTCHFDAVIPERTWVHQTMLFVCLLINWLCVIVFRHEPKRPKRKWRIDGGRVLMAITNTLVMVQAGFPTGICVVRSR